MPPARFNSTHLKTSNRGSSHAYVNFRDITGKKRSASAIHVAPPVGLTAPDIGLEAAHYVDGEVDSLGEIAEPSAASQQPKSRQRAKRTNAVC
jgi:hypothetical protein